MNNGWIKVEEKDKLPPEGKRVLCYTTSGATKVGFLLGGTWVQDSGRTFEHAGYEVAWWHEQIKSPYD